MEEKRKAYDSDVSDKEWEVIRHYIPGKEKLGRPPRYKKREILNGIFYLTKTGCPWRSIAHDLPPWQIIYYYFASWQRQGVWEQIHQALRNKVRAANGKKKPREVQLSTVRRLKWLGNPENVDMMLARRYWEEKDMF